MKTEEALQYLLELLKALNPMDDFQLREDVKKAIARKLIELNCLG